MPAGGKIFWFRRINASEPLRVEDVDVLLKSRGGINNVPAINVRTNIPYIPTAVISRSSKKLV